MVTLLKTSRNAPWHPWETYRPAILSLWPEAREVEAADWDGAFDGPVVSLADEWDRPISERAAARLVKGVEAGGRLLVLHQGISLQARSELADLIGGKFTGHPEAGPLSFRPVGIEVPGWQFADEPYRFEMLASVEPLLEYEDAEGLHLGAWTRTAGKGRVVFLMPGHTADHWNSPAYREFVKACWEKFF
jgi:type 1 glutamine amidotransferase